VLSSLKMGRTIFYRCFWVVKWCKKMYHTFKMGLLRWAWCDLPFHIVTMCFF